MTRARPSVVAGITLGVIGAYRVALSPLVGATCRFWPSCSQFAQEAVCRHGAWRGGLLALGRLARCRPFGPVGYDPVPEAACGGHKRRVGTDGGTAGATL